MKIAVTGSNGLLGHGIVQSLRLRHQVVPLPHDHFEITDAANVHRVLASIRADVIIHAAANPDPDKCQLDPEGARRVNVDGTANIVSAARELGGAVALISTDAVFDGRQQTPYFETDPPNPISVYGQTKLEAERAVQKLTPHYIFRVSVLFGPGKINFLTKGLQKIARGETYIVASDQVGSATYTLDAAATVEQVLKSRRFGLYHLSNQGRCSRLELAQRAAELAGLDKTKVIGMPLGEMHRPGPRPKCTEMGMGALAAAGIPLPRGWENALAEYVPGLGCGL
jgi:dTDP-4-dehydrorhamnose reductase